MSTILNSNYKSLDIGKLQKKLKQQDKLILSLRLENALKFEENDDYKRCIRDLEIEKREHDSTKKLLRCLKDIDGIENFQRDMTVTNNLLQKK
eukprot:UN02659